MSYVLNLKCAPRRQIRIKRAKVRSCALRRPLKVIAPRIKLAKVRCAPHRSQKGHRSAGGANVLKLVARGARTKTAKVWRAPYVKGPLDVLSVQGIPLLRPADLKARPSVLGSLGPRLLTNSRIRCARFGDLYPRPRSIDPRRAFDRPSADERRARVELECGSVRGSAHPADSGIQFSTPCFDNLSLEQPL